MHKERLELIHQWLQNIKLVETIKSVGYLFQGDIDLNLLNDISFHIQGQQRKLPSDSYYMLLNREQFAKFIQTQNDFVKNFNFSTAANINNNNQTSIQVNGITFIAEKKPSEQH